MLLSLLRPSYVPVITPSQTPPKTGDVYRVRLHKGETNRRELIRSMTAGRAVYLDVFNPLDPPVCYLPGDDDRWVLQTMGSPCLGVFGWSCEAMWQNPAFNAPAKVKVTISWFGRIKVNFI